MPTGAGGSAMVSKEHCAARASPALPSPQLSIFYLFFSLEKLETQFLIQNLLLHKCKKLMQKINKTKHYATVEAKPNTPADHQPVPSESEGG